MLLACLLLAVSCLAQGGGTRYQTPAAYPEPESAAVWRSLGASYVRKALRENALDRNPELNARIDAIMSAVSAAARTLYPPASGTSWQAILIEDFGHGATAFPGGAVLVDARFVQQLELSDDELALVMAHEVAHVVAGHPSEKLSFMAETLGKEKAPNAGSALRAFFEVDTYALMFQPTARLQEREADSIGAAIFHAAGYDPQRALQLFDKLAKLEKSGFGSPTHDSATARRESLGAAFARLGAGEPAVKTDKHLP